MTQTAAVNTSVPSSAPAEATKSWFLVGCLGEATGLSHISIGKVPFAIGRAANNDLTLRSRNVSKFHAQILVAVDAVLLAAAASQSGSGEAAHHENLRAPSRRHSGSRIALST